MIVVFWFAAGLVLGGMVIATPILTGAGLVGLGGAIWWIDRDTRRRNRDASRELRRNEARARENGKPHGSLDMVQHVGRER